MKYFVSCQRYASTCYGQCPAMPLEKMHAQMFARKIISKQHIPRIASHFWWNLVSNGFYFSRLKRPKNFRITAKTIYR